MKAKVCFALIIVIILFVNFQSFASDLIFSEYFNGPYPGSWNLSSNYSMGWAWPNGYAHEYSSPSGGQYYYPNNLAVSMQRRNIDLSCYTGANLSFYYVVDTEANYDFFEVWVQDSSSTWYRMLRESGPHDLSWRFKSIDFSYFAGQSGLTIEFYFDSDGSVSGSDGDYDGVFLDVIKLTATPEIVVNVTSPNGGESLLAGTTHNITWTPPCGVDNVKIELSTDNKSNWTTIASSTPNDGIHPWTVPNSPSSQCFIRISDASDGTPSDVSDDPFTIVEVPPEEITITSPNGGEKWYEETRHNIKWTSTNVEYVKIEYSINNGSKWNVIVSSTPSDGIHPWIVPDLASTSNKCLVRISDASDGNPWDTSDSTFSIAPATKTITVTSPNGGENWTAGSSHDITWTSKGSVGNVKMEYSTDDGSSWSTIISSTNNSGTYSWTVPNTPSNQCCVKISEASDESLYDESDSYFSIVSPFIVNSPNGGENWGGGTPHNITWDSPSAAQNVKIEYSINNGNNWTLVTTSTLNDKVYEWTIPNTPSSECLVRISDIFDSSLYDDSDDVFSITMGPKIALNRTQLNFGADTGGNVTDAQNFLIENDGGGALMWTISTNVNWLGASPSVGSNSGVVNVYVNPSGFSPGVYNGTLTISAPNASNSPRTINVILNVFKAGKDDYPFGDFATPQDGSTVRSSVPVTGWVLDDIGVEQVEIWRKNWVTDPGGDGYWEEKFIGNAVFVEGARPDVEQAYPAYPMNYQAGWGYMMLTNFLPNQGNGTFIISAKAVDKTGKEVTLGEKTIYCDNKNATKPFGAIDTPTAGGTASGNNYQNQGWVLTPMPNKIPENGFTIDVYIDGVNLGHPTYNIYRADIADLFPGYANSNGAHGYFFFDTTTYPNGVHTIQWTATDNAGNADGIGSRYFSIQNTGGTSSQTSNSSIQSSESSRYSSIKELSDVSFSYAEPAYIIRGFTPGIAPQMILPDESGVINIEVMELERIAVLLFDNNTNDSVLVGFLKVGDQLKTLPIGSTLDTQKAIFYWQPGPGFLGEYNFIFMEINRNELKKINVKILPWTLE